MSWLIIISFIIAGTSGHGYAISDTRYSTVELCEAEMPAMEADVRMNFARSHHAEVELYSECIVDIKDTERAT